MASSQLIFVKGKEKALDALFNGSSTDKPAFGYLAIGYSDDIGFVDPGLEEDSTQFVENNFNEIEGSERLILTKATDSPVTIDTETGKVTVRYQAVLETGNINNQNINQIAVINNEEKTDTDQIYSATSFQTFYKTNQTSLTFVIAFQL